MLGRNCGSTRNSCRTQLSINHSPLNCFGYVTFWINIDDSTLSVGVQFAGSATVVFAQWSPRPPTPRPLSTMSRYIAVSNEVDRLSFALYRDENINACYVNETVTLLTEQLFEVV